MSSRLLLQGGWECGNYLWKYRKDLLIEAEGYHYLIRSRSVRNKSRSRTKNPIAPRCWSISAQYLSSPENLIPIWKLWELTVNLRANGEITPPPEGLYIRQRAIRVRDCASIIPECPFLPSNWRVLFFCLVRVCPSLHRCPAIPTWHEISGSNDHFCNSSISGAPSAFFVLQKFSWNMLCRMPTRPSQIWCSSLVRRTMDPQSF